MSVTTRRQRVLALVVGLSTLTATRRSFAQDFDAVPSAPTPAPAAAPSTVAPPRRSVHVRLEGGPSVKSLYQISFYGGQLRAGMGGHFDGGRSRLFGTTQFFYGTDATALRFLYGSLGVLYERALVGPVFLGGSLDLSFGSVSSAQNDYVASGIGLGLHLGYDILGTPGGRALFVQLSPSTAVFTGHDAGGPASFGGALEVGYRQ